MELKRGGGTDGDHGEKDRHGEIEKDGLILFARKKREEGGLRGFYCLGLLHINNDVQLYIVLKNMLFFQQNKLVTLGLKLKFCL
jgi:hypothetical protein